MILIFAVFSLPIYEGEVFQKFDTTFYCCFRNENSGVRSTPFDIFFG